MSSIYAPCLCGSGKKFKFCCRQVHDKKEMVLTESACAKFPIHKCMILENWQESGVTPVYVVRELAKDSYVFVSYLIDSWCLGLKSVIVKLGISGFQLESMLKMGSHSLVIISYQDARSVILGAIDFAQSLDISPNSEWSGMPSAFIEASQPYDNKFTFGKDGAPMYISGPYDYKNYNVDDIMDKVQAANGHYILHLPN